MEQMHHGKSSGEAFLQKLRGSALIINALPPNFPEKLLKILATRGEIFSLKFTKYRLAAGLRPDPLGELKRSPRPLSRNNGRLLLRTGERRGEGREGKGKGRGNLLQGVRRIDAPGCNVIDTDSQ